MSPMFSKGVALSFHFYYPPTGQSGEYFRWKERTCHLIGPDATLEASLLSQRLGMQHHLLKIAKLPQRGMKAAIVRRLASLRCIQLSMQWLRDGITETMQTQRFWSQGLIARFGVHGRHKPNRAAAHPQVIAKRVTSATMHGGHKSSRAAAHTQCFVKCTMLAKLHGRHKSICATAHAQVIVKRTMLNDLCRLRLGTL